MAKQTDRVDRLSRYVALISKYVEGGLPASDFETGYTELYLDDATMWPEDEYDILESLHSKVDAFVDDPELLPDVIGGIGESELRTGATEALAKLRALTN